MAKITTLKIQEMKDRGEKISMVTAYDYPTACMVEKAGIEIILVGDSLMMAVLGDDSTVSCTMDQMIHHIKPVVKGAPSCLIVGDMPFGSYNESKKQAVHNAARLLKEGRCDVVKLEGGKEVADTVKAIVDAGVPVMAHIGLTPQTVSKLGGFKVQGKGEAAKDVLEDALALQEAGAFSIVLECIPEQLGKLITEKLDIPTIGIGAGRYTDGQVMVFHDMMGLFEKFVPKFVKQYRNLGSEITKALEEYKEDVKSGAFPEEKHTFGGVSEEELKRLY
ncbi:MAG TPA: 3-methyl-2-oxobutanoate hydroxymethyltransferase [Bacillota bacterium]|jgi:3-methyl-2-oxobutanoate hydroxymethyltransferase|nr:3-methyl-2-oxobutanoate hydroxymethyltransferase [Clostridiales bacterium UBA9856]HOA41842.1 3-methyl-2-oxobutanoate hydroxymethyltransferase [Bacillota bacterium]HQC83125.1 3-methyl-2-oxobutanoate hydroxymethyltransferase [Bacillota bacterium]